jgi:hypothetical protein
MKMNVKPVQTPCYQVKKITLTQDQIKEKERKLAYEYSAMNIPLLDKIVDWDGKRHREYEEKKKHLDEVQEKIPCEISKTIESRIDSNTESKTENKKEDKKIETISVVHNKPKETQQKKNTKKSKSIKKNEKLAKKEPKVIKVVSKPPVAQPSPAVFVQTNDVVNSPEDKLNKFKSYYYFYKEDLIKKPKLKQQVKNKWQELAVEMAKYRGTQVYEDFIRFSGQEVAQYIK